MNKKGILVVFSGPSGCGKGTVLERFLQKNTDTFISISATTRAPRPDEIHGQQYYFISHDEFENRIKNDGMLEYAEYCGNFYGTPKKEVFEKLGEGINVILEIEVKGAMQIKDKCPESILVFVAPPSMKELRNRLEGRNTETQEAIDARINTAYEEMKLAYNYDYIITNDIVEDAAKRLENVIQAESCNNKNMKDFLHEVLKNA